MGLLGLILVLALLVALFGIVDVLEGAFWVLLNVIVAVAVVAAATMVARWVRSRR